MHSTFFSIVLISLLIIKEMEAPSPKLRRTHRIRHPHGEGEIIDLQRASSSSSTSIFSSHGAIPRGSLREIDLNSAADHLLRERIAERAHLNEAMESTQTGGRINPARDGALSL